MASTTFAFNATSQSSPTFSPRAGYGFNISLSGVFVATVGLYRNLPGDSGGTWRLLSNYTTPTEASIIEWENGATYQLQSTAYTSGTANGRIGQTI